MGDMLLRHYRKRAYSLVYPCQSDFNNTISKSGEGIDVRSGSSNNNIFGNTIADFVSQAILINDDS